MSNKILWVVFAFITSFVICWDAKADNRIPIIQPSIEPGILTKTNADTLSNANGLDLFLKDLYNLREGKDTILNIVHLGDSHIQAGYYSGEMMHLMQATFGCSGRGWIAPLKISRTNEPDDYFIRSSIKKWTYGRANQRNPKVTWGLGGVAIKADSPSIDFTFGVTPINGRGYAFNKIILYRSDQAMPMLPSGSYKEQTTVLKDTSGHKLHLVADTFQLSNLTDTFVLHSTRRKQGSDLLLPASNFSNIYYGFNLLNGHQGILYHSIGINGAMFVHYTKEDYIKQLALLNPSLLIVSMGTNETFGRNFNTTEFKSQIRQFLLLVKKHLPTTAILLTTPPECYKRKYVNKKRIYVRNTNTRLAAHAIETIATEENIACWNLFKATGGNESCEMWFKKKLLRSDRIHFTQEGYKIQGKLLFRALINEYNRTYNTKNETIDTVNL